LRKRDAVINNQT